MVFPQPCIKITWENSREAKCVCPLKMLLKKLNKYTNFSKLYLAPVALAVDHSKAVIKLLFIYLFIVYCCSVRGSSKLCQRGSNPSLTTVFCFCLLVDERRYDPYITKNWPSSARQRICVGTLFCDAVLSVHSGFVLVFLGMKSWLLCSGCDLLSCGCLSFLSLKANVV